MVLDAWVICNNHYHLLLGVSDGKQIPKFTKHLHGSTAHYIRQHMPSMVISDHQVLTREITPWDKRQKISFLKRTGEFQRGLKSANIQGVVKPTGVVAQFIAPDSAIAKFISRHPEINDPEVLALLSVKDPPIWYQYMDHVIRDEEDYYKHLNYIHQNPVKHAYTDKLTDYKWSSIHTWIEDKGNDFISDCFRTYPIIDFEPTAGAD